MRLWWIASIIFLLGSPALADLVPVVQETGNISVSVDAEGNNQTAGGTLRVEKPAGATVRRAVLMANSHGVLGNRVIDNGDVILAGEPVDWQRSVFNGIGSNASFFHNVFGDVTSIVKPILDPSPAGEILIPVREVGTQGINGTVLVVIFDDPSQPTLNTVILQFGGQDTDGDTFVINFAEPFDPSIERAEMGLGIGHSFQGTSGTPMVNRIDVNGQRLTSSAGGEDDGTSVNGALITVGGIGDSSDNPPNPFAGSSGQRTDDELYDMLPFISPGDTQVEVFSVNPTDDDNIFFAYFFISAPSATLPPVEPPADRTVIGEIDRTRPTIILTHGLQDDDTELDELWSGTRDHQAADLIRADMGQDVNVVQYIWGEAFQDFDCFGLEFPDRESYIAAREGVNDAGVGLANALLIALGPDYDLPLHFVGHSLGTAVNAFAAAALLGVVDSRDVQFTALDRPHHIGGICNMNEGDEALFGFDADFFASVLPIDRPGLNLRIDNYFSRGGAGVGDIANGPVYNHPELVDSNDIDDRIIDDDILSNNHSGVHQWYRWTMAPNDPFPGGPTVCAGDDFDPSRRPAGFDPSLNPCQQGWHWSVTRTFDDFPADNGPAFVGAPETPLPLTQTLEFGCEVETTGPTTTISCVEQSSPFLVAEVFLPDDATSLSFQYRFASLGDGDYAAVLLDEVPIWKLSGQSVPEGAYIDSGPIPVGELTGRRRLTVALYGVGAPNAAFELRNLETNGSGDCVAGPDRLCLNQERFRVEVDWRDFDGNTGTAQVVPFGADDSGLLWFFGPDNWEMLVKVLDGCSANDHFWVFAAATTNVEYTLRVTDTETGARKTYINPLGSSAAAIADIEALPSCTSAQSPTETVTYLESVEAPAKEVAESPEQGSVTSGPFEKEGCNATSTSLCLSQDRFRVEVDWRDFAGNTGAAEVVPFGSDDSGLLWFFGPDNWEMLVKVLDGCSANGHVWVFAAASTNVEYTLRVTDTMTGDVKTYVNPLGRIANATTDTTAFAACP